MQRRIARIAYLAAVLLASAGLAHGEDNGPQAVEVRKAVERSLPFLEEKGVAWIKQKGCVTCHQTTFLIWTHNEAERRGFPVDRRKVSEWTNWALLHALTLSDSLRPSAYPGDENGDDTLSQFILGRDLAPEKPSGGMKDTYSPSTSWYDPYESVLNNLLKAQTQDGRWVAGGQSGNPDAIPTAWAVLALAARDEFRNGTIPGGVSRRKVQGPLERRMGSNDKAVAPARDKALAWLESVEPGKPGVTGTIYEGKPTKNPDTLNERLVLRLLVARKFGKPGSADERLKELLARQAADGGWEANPELHQPSDAFATGQSLYALCLAGNGDEKVKAAIERACKFLVAKQEQNGSWLVPTTVFHPSSGRPARDRKTDDVYTFWGTAWATLGLLHTLPVWAKDGVGATLGATPVTAAGAEDLGKPKESKALEGEYLIESALKSGMVLDVTGAKTEDLTPIQLAGPGNQENRRWRLISVGKSEYLIESALKKWVILEVRGAKAEKGTPIQLGGSGDYPQDQGMNRRWKLIPAGENGEYRIESLLKEGLVLEVKDGTAEDFTPIQVGEWENEAKQRWRLIRVDLGQIDLPAAASGDDEVSKLQARIEKLEAEIKALKQQVAKLTEQPANQKKPPTGAEVVIEIANEDDITIGAKKHTLSSLRRLLADSPPREVTVRRKDSTTEGLYNAANAVLRKNGYSRHSQLGLEEFWVLTEQLAKQKKPPTGAEVVIEIANEDDITIGEKKHTLSSLRKLLTDSPPREVTVRRADSTSQGLYNDMHALLRKNGYTRDSQLGYEEIFVPKPLPSKQP
jgi:antitoxin component of MazEF toxin-antitoxin module